MSGVHLMINMEMRWPIIHLPANQSSLQPIRHRGRLLSERWMWRVMRQGRKGVRGEGGLVMALGGGHAVTSINSETQ